MKNVYILSLVLFLIIAIGSLKVYSTDGSCCRDGQLPERIPRFVSHTSGDTSGDTSDDQEEDQEEDQPMVFALDKACMKAYLENLDGYAKPSYLSKVVNHNIKEAAARCSEEMERAYRANSSSFDFDPRAVSYSAASDTTSCVSNVYGKTYRYRGSFQFPSADCQFIGYSVAEYTRLYGREPELVYDFTPIFYINVPSMVNYFVTKYEEYGGKVIETDKANYPPGNVVFKGF